MQLILKHPDVLLLTLCCGVPAHVLQGSVLQQFDALCDVSPVCAPARLKRLKEAAAAEVQQLRQQLACSQAEVQQLQRQLAAVRAEQQQ